jgi:arylsulfatase A-like enzyme
VPLIVALPGRIRQLTRSARVASLVDVAPTILDLIGAAAPFDYEGASLVGRARRDAMFFADYSLRLVGLREGPLKVIHEIDSGRSQLFDLTDDPGEMFDVANRHPDEVRRYVQRLNEWIR